VSSDKFVWRDLVPLVERIIKIVENEGVVERDPTHGT